MVRKGLVMTVICALSLAGSVAMAQAGPPAALAEVVVTAQRLDAERSTIEPALGATSYVLPQAFIANLPGGANAQLNQVVLQAPGVAQDSFGQLHIRGDHGNIQYRLNNVILPEGLAVFSQTLSARLAQSIQLVTGALPAQYGLRTAGIINITAKSGFNTGGEASLYGDAHGVMAPSVEGGGSFGASSAFGSASYTATDVGIESPNGRARPRHDHSDQYQAFGYFDHIMDGASRVSLIAGTSQQTFEIPNITGLQPDLGLSVNGRTAFASERLDQRQREGSSYGIAAYQRSTDKLTLQASLFARYSSLRYRPDVTGELLFNGLAQAARKTDIAFGLQLEGAYTLNDDHTVRAGLIASGDRTTSATTTQVLRRDALGVQVGDQPVTIAEHRHDWASTYSAFLQDEWRLSEDLVLNYGLRFDLARAFASQRQLSPRASLVWTPAQGLTLHAGYARYFTPAPFALVASQSVAKFVGTTGQAPGVLNDPPRAQRDNYYDLGVQQKIGSLTLGIDAYLKQSRNLLDEGQFGAPIILTPFNYRRGFTKGVEFSGAYARGGFTAYANLAISQAKGRDIVTSQFNFDPADLAYIANHDINLDHDQTYTSSAGLAYRFGDSHVSADLIHGSGLRRDGAVPNGGKLPAYTQVNLGASHAFEGLPGGALTIRADIINVFDKRYAIRDGSGIGVGAPQYGPRRGVFAGVTKAF